MPDLKVGKRQFKIIIFIALFFQKYDFCVAEFTESNMIEIISEKWISGIGRCVYPTTKTPSDASKMAKKHSQPENEWETFKVKILARSGKLHFMITINIYEELHKSFHFS